MNPYDSIYHAAGVAFFFLVVFFIIGFLIWAGTFILGALGLYNIAKRENMKNPWLAFIPVAQLYIIGSMLKKVKVLNLGFEIPSLEILLPVAPIAAWVLSFLPVLWVLVSAAFVAFMVLCLWEFFKLYKSNDTAILFTIFSGIFILFSAFGGRHLLLFTYLGLLAPVLIFTMKDAKKTANPQANTTSTPPPGQDQSNG